MAVMRTYQGVVRKGTIRITPPFDLPEGSEVYPDAVVLVRQVTAEPDRVLHMPSLH